jgi:hypothetical protein
MCPVLGSQVLNVYVGPGVDVVEQIPAGMIGVFVYYKIVAAVPTPISGNKPIPGRNFKVEAAREPEPMVVAVDADHVVAVVRSKMLKVTMLKGTVKMVALVIRGVVTIPVIIVDVLRSIRAAVGMVLLFCSSVVAPRGRWWWNSSLIGPRRISASRLRTVFLTVFLSARGLSWMLS